VKQLVTELFREHGGFILRRCRQLLKDDAAAADAAQEVFLRIVEKLDGFRGEASPVTWIYRIATNVCLDELRRQARKPTLELTPELAEALGDPQASAEQRAIHRDHLAVLFRKADAVDLQILVHTHLDGMTQEEVAEVMGLSRKSVWTRLQRLQRVRS
jgi:RNA polymerase sigma factor (sigma-70 family)